MVQHIAYPYGSSGECGPREFRLAEEMGFATGVTTERWNLYPEHQHRLFALPRVTISMVPHSASVRFLRVSMYGAWNRAVKLFR